MVLIKKICQRHQTAVKAFTLKTYISNHDKYEENFKESLVTKEKVLIRQWRKVGLPLIWEFKSTEFQKS